MVNSVKAQASALSDGASPEAGGAQHLYGNFCLKCCLRYMEPCHALGMHCMRTFLLPVPAGPGACAERPGVAARARGAGRRRRGGRRCVGAALRRAARGILAARVAAGAGCDARRRGGVWRGGPGCRRAARRARRRPPRSMEGAPTRIHLCCLQAVGAFFVCK